MRESRLQSLRGSCSCFRKARVERLKEIKGLAAADFTDDNPWFPRGLDIILWNVNSRATLPKQNSGTEHLQRFVIGFLCELPLQSRIYRIRERSFARAVQFPVPQSGSAIWRGNVDRARLDRSVR